MQKSKLRVIVITQQDGFFIPKNVISLAGICEVIEIVDNHAKGSVENKISDMVKWFGVWQCAKMAAKTGLRRIQDIIDSCTAYRLFGGQCSIKSAAKKLKVSYITVCNVNSEQYIKHVREQNPDLIISYSAPQVIEPVLLNVPKYGVLNVHGALLPNYRGLLPSFWYLYNDEKTGGATVHFMSAAIDDGDICVQKSIDISDCKSVYQVMCKTKRAGGEAMIEAVQAVSNGTLQPRKNDTANGSYFTWPTVEQAKEFRGKGKKLI